MNAYDPVFKLKVAFVVISEKGRSGSGFNFVIKKGNRREVIEICCPWNRDYILILYSGPSLVRVALQSMTQARNKLFFSY